MVDSQLIVRIVPKRHGWVGGCSRGGEKREWVGEEGLGTSVGGCQERWSRRSSQGRASARPVRTSCMKIIDG